MADNYLIIGEEAFLVEEKVKELAQKFGGQEDWSLEKPSSWDAVKDKLLDLPMFSGPRVFIMDYQRLIAGKPDPDGVGRLLASHDNVVIIFSKSKPDKGSRLFKQIAKTAKLIQVSAPRGYELANWLIRRGKELGASEFTKRAAETLIYLVGTDMMALENELEKLIRYSSEISVESVRTLAVPSAQASIFELVDAVVTGQVAKGQITAENMLRGGTEVPYMLFMLARQYRLLYRYLFYRTEGRKAPEIKGLLPSMHPYAFDKLRAQALKLDLKQCSAGLKAVLEADHGYKTGIMDGAGLIQGLLIKLAKK